MHRREKLTVVVFAAVTLLASTTNYVHAVATFTTLHEFTGFDGANPQAGVTSVGSILYGTTNSGGADSYGTVYRFNLADNSFGTLHSFSNASEGNLPAERVAAIGSALYGAAFSGGPSGAGTVYELGLSNNTLAILHSFSTSEDDGAYPATVLAQVGTKLYGTTQGITTQAGQSSVGKPMR